MATTLGVKVDESLQKRLRALAEVKDRSTHWLIKQAIDQYVAREEAIERDRREDRERWEHYALTGHSVTNPEATAWLDELANGQATPWPP